MGCGLPQLLGSSLPLTLVLPQEKGGHPPCSCYHCGKSGTRLAGRGMNRNQVPKWLEPAPPASSLGAGVFGAAGTALLVNTCEGTKAAFTGQSPFPTRGQTCQLSTQLQSTFISENHLKKFTSISPLDRLTPGRPCRGRTPSSLRPSHRYLDISCRVGACPGFWLAFLDEGWCEFPQGGSVVQAWGRGAPWEGRKAPLCPDLSNIRMWRMPGSPHPLGEW